MQQLMSRSQTDLISINYSVDNSVAMHVSWSYSSHTSPSLDCVLGTKPCHLTTFARDIIFSESLLHPPGKKCLTETIVRVRHRKIMNRQQSLFGPPTLSNIWILYPKWDWMTSPSLYNGKYFDQIDHVLPSIKHKYAAHTALHTPPSTHQFVDYLT